MRWPCPHCFERPESLDMHLRFECPKLVGRSRYVPPLPKLIFDRDKFFRDLEKLLQESLDT